MLPFIGRPWKTKTRTQSSEHGVIATGKQGRLLSPAADRFWSKPPQPHHDPPTGAALQEYFPSGTSAANLLGISTQNPKRGEVATNSLSLPRKLIGAETRVHARRPEAWKALSETEDAILDVLRNGGEASGLSPDETTARNLHLLSVEKRLEKLLKIASTEPPRVRALLGAFAEALKVPSYKLKKLRSTLNSLSRFNFGQFAALPTARKWLAKGQKQHADL